MFHKLFYCEEDQNMFSIPSAWFKFFYFRTSPRGNSKFGVMDIPWQRLRVQQQGTDEEIQFDRIWLAKSTRGIWPIESIETKLKSFYDEYCLARKNQRAGHTEWFSNINSEVFEEKFSELAEYYGVEVKKIVLSSPYIATKKSHCPFRSPTSYETVWYDEFWAKN